MVVLHRKSCLLDVMVWRRRLSVFSMCLNTWFRGPTWVHRVQCASQRELSDDWLVVHFPFPLTELLPYNYSRLFWPTCTWLWDYYCPVGAQDVRWSDFFLFIWLGWFYTLILILLSRSDQDPSQKFLYIEMELCSSGTLQLWIENENKSQSHDRKEESLRIFRQVVRGVEYIHANDFIHRDLKVRRTPPNRAWGGPGPDAELASFPPPLQPANIMFSHNKENKIVKIGDFGLVTAVANNTQNPMERTVYKGTPWYMAPEQVSCS